MTQATVYQDLSKHLHLIEEFIQEMESNPSDYLGIEVKTRGTLIETNCKNFLEQKLGISIGGSAANGVDLPIFNTDIKSTSMNQPQSSSPYKSISEKLFGFPYNILLFIYRIDDDSFTVEHCAYIPQEYTGCKLGTRFIKKLNDDICKGQITQELATKALKGWLFNVADFASTTITNKVKNYVSGKVSAQDFKDLVHSWEVIEPQNILPNWDEIWERVRNHPPKDGVIHYSFALQWRLQYSDLAIDIYPNSDVNKIR